MVVLRFTGEPDPTEGAEPTQGAEALAALAACPGFERGRWCRAFDDPTVWCLVTEWASVGAYRRALSTYDVRVRGTALLSRAVPEPSAFEPLAWAGPGGPVVTAPSDRAPDGDAAGPGVGPIASRA
jgi:hypothetical protein